ncbi:MAG: ABC transporter permease [Kineosporiaceae bacterium]
MILRQAVRNLLSSKLRLFLTSLAVVLGVGFVVGSLVLGDTMNKAFDDVFATANEGVAVQVKGVKTVSEADRQPVPASALATIRAVDGVRSAHGEVFGTAQIIGRDGEPAGLSGPPTLGFGWSDDAQLNPLRITAGGPPRAAGDVVIDKTTAEDEGFAVGDRVRIITADGSDEYRLVGIVAFGEQNNLVGATLASFTTATAQRVLDSAGRFSTVSVSAEPGVADAALASRIQAVLPAGYEAITGEAAAEDASDQFKQFIDIFRNFLLAFAFIALFVGAFIIFNAFKITVAQRTRQLGLLRAVGASGSQVVRSVMLEALFVGVAASIVGIIFGIGFAALLRAGFNAIGAALPPTTLQVQPRSIIAGLIVGLLVTLAAAVGPAWKASRVPPIAAMREVTLTERTGLRVVASVAVSGLGVALVLTGLFAPLDGLAQRFGLIGLGAVLLFIGAAMLTGYVARPLAWLIGAPMARMGLAGRLGRENAMRNPLRTAQTAAALTIGVALVTGVTIFTASITETFRGALHERVLADVVIVASNQLPFSPAATAALSETPEISRVTAWREGQFKDADDGTRTLSAIDPVELEDVYDPGVSEGAMVAVSQGRTIAVHEDYARDHDLSVGSTMPVLFAKTGESDYRVGAIFTDDGFGDFSISLDEYRRNFATQQDIVILARAAEGVSPEEAKAAAERDLRAFSNLDVRTKAEYEDFVVGQIDQFLRLFYVLLAMAVVIAIFGIILTLALSVFERTREIGLLRAVGLSRRSVRAMIRWEAIIVALIGALVGLVVGVFLGVVSVSAIPEFKALAIPWISMLAFLVIAALFGVLAAILPARRAAHLNILEAIQSE